MQVIFEDRLTTIIDAAPNPNRENALHTRDTHLRTVAYIHQPLRTNCSSLYIGQGDSNRRTNTRQLQLYKPELFVSAQTSVFLGLLKSNHCRSIDSPDVMHVVVVCRCQKRN